MLYAMNNVNLARTIREALAWRGYSYLEAAAEIPGMTPQNLVEGKCGLWKIMALTGATEKQMYNWGKN